jgi:hypothetical protein
MNEKLNQLFTAAKRETPVAPGEGFASLVMNQIQRNPTRAELTMSDLLGMWFPRLAVAAAAVIALCVISEVVTSSNAPSLSDSAAQLSDQLFVEN